MSQVVPRTPNFFVRAPLPVSRLPLWGMEPGQLTEIDTVGRTCVPQDIAGGHKHTSKWGLQVMSEFDIPTSSATSCDSAAEEPADIAEAKKIVQAWKDKRPPASSGDVPAGPTATLGVATTGPDVHNLWHPGHFTTAEAGYVTCTLCGVSLFAGQEAMHGRGRKHSLKAAQAASKPSPACRGLKWCCSYACLCRQDVRFAETGSDNLR